MAGWHLGLWAMYVLLPMCAVQSHPYRLMLILLLICMRAETKCGGLWAAPGAQDPPASGPGTQDMVTLTQASQHDPNRAEVGESAERKGGDGLGSLLEGTVAGDGHFHPGAAPEHPEPSTQPSQTGWK